VRKPERTSSRERTFKNQSSKHEKFAKKPVPKNRKNKKDSMMKQIVNSVIAYSNVTTDSEEESTDQAQ